jgi:hypothetical protein
MLVAIPDLLIGTTLDDVDVPSIVALRIER